jgi:hypothetical protein
MEWFALFLTVGGLCLFALGYLREVSRQHKWKKGREDQRRRDLYRTAEAIARKRIEDQ